MNVGETFYRNLLRGSKVGRITLSLSKLATYALLFASQCASTSWAFTVRPADGLWGITSEQNLAIGRAFNVEVFGNLGVITFYNYNASKLPTFYVGAGQITATNTLTVPLNEPAGGTCLGCPPTSGYQLSSKGNALFEFTSSSSGYVTLPGEPRKAILKGLGQTAPDGLKGIWAFSYISSSSNPPIASADVAVLNTLIGPTPTGSGIVASSNGKSACELQVTGTLSGRVVCSMLGSSSAFDKAVLANWWADHMDGVWKYSSINATDLMSARRFISGTGDDLGVKEVIAIDANLAKRLRENIERFVVEYRGD